MGLDERRADHRPLTRRPSTPIIPRMTAQRSLTTERPPPKRDPPSAPRALLRAFLAHPSYNQGCQVRGRAESHPWQPSSSCPETRILSGQRRSADRDPVQNHRGPAERLGHGWDPAGAQAMLHLTTLEDSNEWEAYWQLFDVHQNQSHAGRTFACEPPARDASRNRRCSQPATFFQTEGKPADPGFPRA